MYFPKDAHLCTFDVSLVKTFEVRLSTCLFLDLLGCDVPIVTLPSCPKVQNGFHKQVTNTKFPYTSKTLFFPEKFSTWVINIRNPSTESRPYDDLLNQVCTLDVFCFSELSPTEKSTSPFECVSECELRSRPEGLRGLRRGYRFLYEDVSCNLKGYVHTIESLFPVFPLFCLSCHAIQSLKS